MDDPALDLSVCMAVISSYQEITIPQDTCFAAEIGLSGELRTVSRIDNRIMEAEKQGFKKIVISNYNKRNLNKKKSPIEIITCQRVDQVIQKILGDK